MRHSHATALLLSGVPVHVVSRRLGHADVQTTLQLYAHVTEDAELRAVARWAAFIAGWRLSARRRRSGRGVLVNGGRGQLARNCWGRRRGADPRRWRPCGRRCPGRCGCRGSRRPASRRGTPARSATAGPAGRRSTCRTLPAPMSREMAWCMFRIIEMGGTVAVPAAEHAGPPARRGHRRSPGRPRRPGAGLAAGAPGPGVVAADPHAVHRRTGRLPAPATMRNLGSLLARMCACWPPPWTPGRGGGGTSGIPSEDSRIPLREHEPMGRYTVRFGQIGIGWLRAGTQWHCKTGLETGTLTWSSVHHRAVPSGNSTRSWPSARSAGPSLADRPAAVRGAHAGIPRALRTRPASPRAPGREAAVRRSGRAPGRRHRAVLRAHGRQQRRRGRRAGRARLARAGTRARRVLPARRASRQADRPELERPGHQRGRDDPDHGRVALLGAPAAEGGLRRRAGHAHHHAGGPAGQAHQRDLHAGPRPAAAAASPARAQRPGPRRDGQAPVAKLRYQQTKIDGAPDTVLVDDEVVAIVREQQQWAAARAAARSARPAPRRSTCSSPRT